MLTNLYGAVVVFAALVPELQPTSAEATIICSMMLIAHSLPVELSISKKAGAPFWPIACLRIFGALIYGMILHGICKLFGIWQETAIVIFKAEKQVLTLFQWAVNQFQNLGLIVVVIFCILVIMRILRTLGVLQLLERILEPLLPPFGMSRAAAPITVVGMVLGISYGGALIIKETTSGALSRRDIFFAMALMGLSHSLIEDTLLMVALGGLFSGILWGRLVFSLLVIFILAKVVMKSQTTN
jgi:spore maturation protein SpmB